VPSFHRAVITASTLPALAMTPAGGETTMSRTPCVGDVTASATVTVTPPITASMRADTSSRAPGARSSGRGTRTRTLNVPKRGVLSTGVADAST
jgi:hypothetical protein